MTGRRKITVVLSASEDEAEDVATQIEDYVKDFFDKESVLVESMTIEEASGS